MTTFVFKGNDGVPAALDFGRIAGELKQRGFSSIIVRTPRAESKTPNQDSANAIVEALRDVRDDVVIVGVSHQGLFLPLIAAARPVRRLVYVNAVIPRPGRPFIEILKEENVFAPGLLDATIKSVKGMTREFLNITLDPDLPVWLRKLIQWSAPISGAKSRIDGLLEPCPLKELPKVESVFISAAQDQAVRPEWQQRAARESLGIEAIVISGARHGSILSTHRREVAAAIAQGLQPNPASSLQTKSLNEKTGSFESQSNMVLLGKLLRKRVGVKGILFSAMPLLIFAGVYLSSSSLIAAIWSSVSAAIAILLLQLLCREPLWPAIVGLVGVAIETFIAYVSGSGRGFFLLHIWSSLCFAGIFLASVLLRWPLVGVIWSRLNGTGLRWRADRLSQFYYGLATLSWVAVFAARFVVLHWLYDANAVGLLALIRIVMGHPLGVLSLLINIWAIRRASARENDLEADKTLEE